MNPEEIKEKDGDISPSLLNQLKVILTDEYEVILDDTELREAALVLVSYFKCLSGMATEIEN